MRDKIVVGTLDCIVQFGYESTTMAKIAAMAKVSPGAMQYHFGSRIEAIKAAIDHLHTIRLAEHQEALKKVPEGVDPMDYTFDLYWHQLKDDQFVAYQDLVIAARTHPELAAVLEPAYQSFLKVWREHAFQEVPQWTMSNRFHTICDLAQYVMEGLAYGQINSQLPSTRVEKLLELTKQLVIELLAEDLDATQPDEEKRNKPL